MTAYYNEIDPFAAQWLRELIKARLIAPGEVDERSIEDVRPDELSGYKQCHFFAGIGVWSHALRMAGWPDDRPVWTGSCPCQPFSDAGKGLGFDDKRHLWPAWQWLINERRPSVIFGEQVASKSTEPWIDLVQTDLEGMGYAFGYVQFPSAGVGAPHLRDRTYWLADAEGERRARQHLREGAGRSSLRAEDFSEFGGMADMHTDRLSEVRKCESSKEHDGIIGNSASCGPWNSSIDRERPHNRISRSRNERERANRGSGVSGKCGSTGPTNGFWQAADWLFCRDGKWRPVEPGTFPLVNGAAARVGRLRGYGNAINAEAAKAFIETVMAL